MRTCDRNPGLLFHQAAQEICALVNRNPCFLGAFHFRVIVWDGGGAYDPIRSLYIAWMMTYVHRCASFAHFFGKRSEGAVRTAHRVSALQQEAGDGGKTRSEERRVG